MIKSMNLGRRDGKVATSKPILLLSIIEGISMEEVTENKILFGDAKLRNRYRVLSEFFNGRITTQFLPFYIRPFFFLDSEPFYELVWKGAERPATKAQTPSAKYLEEHLAYAKLDDELWLLLQDAENRGYFKQLIIDYYLKEN